MIHIFIPLVVLVSAGSWLRKNYIGLSTLFYALALGCIIFIGLALGQYDDLILKIPFTKIDASEEVSINNIGSFTLEWGSSAFLMNEFTVVDSTTEEELSDWLSDSEKSVTIYIKEASRVVWSKNLGMTDNSSSKSILDIYKTWKSDGVVPKDKVRYSIFNFYFDS